MEMVFALTKKYIDNKFIGKLPTEDQIYTLADEFRVLISGIPVTDEEFAEIKKRLPTEIIHSIGYADTLRKRDGKHQQGWYKVSENDGFFGIVIRSI